MMCGPNMPGECRLQPGGSLPHTQLWGDGRGSWQFHYLGAVKWIPHFFFGQPLGSVERFFPLDDEIVGTPAFYCSLAHSPHVFPCQDLDPASLEIVEVNVTTEDSVPQNKIFRLKGRPQASKQGEIRCGSDSNSPIQNGSNGERKNPDQFQGRKTAPITFLWRKRSPVFRGIRH